MKKITMICSAMMLCFATLAQVQRQDTTSSDYKQKETQGTTLDDAGVRQGTISTEDQAQEGAKPTPKQTDQVTLDQSNQSTHERGESTLVDDKIGPNGEPVFINNGAYYYLNEAGEKVKIEKSALKDKTQ